MLLLGVGGDIYLNSEEDDRKKIRRWERKREVVGERQNSEEDVINNEGIYRNQSLT